MSDKEVANFPNGARVDCRIVDGSMVCEIRDRYKTEPIIVVDKLRSVRITGELKALSQIFFEPHVNGIGFWLKTEEPTKCLVTDINQDGAGKLVCLRSKDFD